MRSKTIRAVAVVKDLFFVARFRETARLAGSEIVFVRSQVELGPALAEPTDLVIIDLTVTGWDYDGLFAVVGNAATNPPVLGVTTHAVARLTQPWHSRCSRVVTRETLTRELGTI